MTRLAPWGVMAAAGLLYAGTLGHGFVLDDAWLVVHGPWVQDLSHWREILLSDYWAPQTRSGLYRPLATLSYALNHALAGPGAAGFHAVNVVLHGLATGLFWLLLRALSDARVAGVAALLFATHAVHSEAVAGISSGRPELLAACGFLLSLWLHVQAERAAKGSAALRGASLAAYAAALLSKEHAVALLPVLFCLDRLGLPGAPGQRAEWRRYGGYLAVTAGVVALRLAALGLDGWRPAPHPIDNPLVELAAPWRMLSALWVSLHALRLLLFPHPLSYDYSYRQLQLIESAADWRLPVLGIVLLVMALGLALLARRSRLGLFALALGGFPFLVVSNWVVPIGTILGERLLYLPSLGFCLGAALVLRAAAERLASASRRRAAVFLALAVVLAAGHAARSLERIPQWKSEERLFLHDVRVSSRSVKAHVNAGLVLSRLGRVREALAHYEEAVALRPDDAGAVNNLGYLLIDRELDVARGVALLERALARHPGHAELRDSLGWGYYKLGRHAEARNLIRSSLELDPAGPTAAARRRHLRVVEAALAASGELRDP